LQQRQAFGQLEKKIKMLSQISGKLKHLTEEILRHCLGNDLSLYTLTGSSYIQRELSAVHQHVQKVNLFVFNFLASKGFII
jgi:hypothetical protein